MLQEQMMSFALMGGEWVLWLLVLLSVLCLTIAVERFIFSVKNQTPLSKIQPILTRFLGGGETAACAKELQELTGMEARILAAGLEAAQSGGAEAASEVVAGQIIFEKWSNTDVDGTKILKKECNKYSANENYPTTQLSP